MSAPDSPAGCRAAPSCSRTAARGRYSEPCDSNGLFDTTRSESVQGPVSSGSAVTGDGGAVTVTVTGGVATAVVVCAGSAVEDGMVGDCAAGVTGLRRAAGEQCGRNHGQRDLPHVHDHNETASRRLPIPKCRGHQAGDKSGGPHCRGESLARSPSTAGQPARRQSSRAVTCPGDPQLAGRGGHARLRLHSRRLRPPRNIRCSVANWSSNTRRSGRCCAVWRWGSGVAAVGYVYTATGPHPPRRSSLLAWCAGVATPLHPGPDPDRRPVLAGVPRRRGVAGRRRTGDRPTPHPPATDLFPGWASC